MGGKGRAWQRGRRPVAPPRVRAQGGMWAVPSGSGGDSTMASRDAVFVV